MSPTPVCCLLADLLQSPPTLCDPMGCSLPDSSVHGILQARILEWVAMPSSRGSSRPRDRMSPALASRFLTPSAAWEAPDKPSLCCKHQLSVWLSGPQAQEPWLGYLHTQLNKLHVFNYNLTLIIQVSSLLLCFPNHFSFCFPKIP